MIKLIIIIVLELDSRVDPGLGRVTSRIKDWLGSIKTIIIVVFKPYLRVDLRPSLGHGPSWPLTW